jgi:hypothetical protein
MLAGRPQAIKAGTAAATQGMIAGIRHCQPGDLLQERDYKRWQRVLLRIGTAYKPAGPDTVGMPDWAREARLPAPIRRFPIEDGTRARNLIMHEWPC